MTNLSEPLSMHRKHRHWRMMAGLPGEPLRLNASPGVSSRVRRDSSQCRCRCSLQLSATSCRLPSPAVVALDSLRRRSQHDAIGATKAPLVEEGRVPGVRYRAIAAEGGVIKETAAWAVFKLRSGALFSRGHEEGRDWPRSVHELGVPHGIRIRVCRARKDNHTPYDTHGLCPKKEDEHCREGEIFGTCPSPKDGERTELAFLHDNCSAAGRASLFPSTISNTDNYSGSAGCRNGAGLEDVGR